MLIYSPRWLFLVPGLVLGVLGAVSAAVLATGTVKVGPVAFSTGTLAVACMSVMVGGQLTAFAFYTKVFAIGEGLLPDDARFSKLFKLFTLEKGIVLGLVVMTLGVGLLVHGFLIWRAAGYGALPYDENMRRLIPAMTLIISGVQIIFGSFFMSVLGLRTASRREPGSGLQQ